MKKLKIGGAVAAVCLALSSWASSLEVTDVKIAQRYPWNGLVDITYTVKSDNPDAEVFVYPIGYDADKATKVALKPQYLSGEGVNGGVRPGTRRMTWDMASQMGKDYNRAAFSVSFIAYCDAKPYMVVDLSEGSSAKDYPISYLSSIPDGGWTDEYKTTKMVFRLIPPGRVSTGTLISEPYYFAIWPMTTRQHALIVGGTGSTGTKTGLSYNDIRGNVLGAKYPEHQQVDVTSIVGQLRLKTGITFDLATVGQWRAAATAYVNDAVRVDSMPNPNVLGVYDIGKKYEWCRDWYTGSQTVRAMCGLCVECRLTYTDEYYATGCEYYSYISLTEMSCIKEGYGRYNGSYAQYDLRVKNYFYPSYSGDTACRLVALPNCK